jgi:hypothetical protein
MSINYFNLEVHCTENEEMGYFRDPSWGYFWQVQTRLNLVSEITLF